MLIQYTTIIIDLWQCMRIYNNQDHNYGCPISYSDRNKAVVITRECNVLIYCYYYTMSIAQTMIKVTKVLPIREVFHNLLT